MQLLENYVLAAVGALPTEEQVKTKVITSRLFGGNAGDHWQTKLREEFGVTETLDEQLRTMWSQAQKLAADKGAEISAQDFAAMVVEENFTDAVEMIATESAKKYEDI